VSVAPIEVAQLDRLAEAEPVVVRAGQRELLLVRIGAEVYALRNSCPHMDTSFAGGAVLAYASGTTEEPRFEEDQPVVACPWHQYEFSLATGRCMTAERLSARTYAVTVRDGKVLVDLAAHAAGARRGASVGD
jgi:nitrite reductase/ring-hydroxylating ferredoxin subunit